MSLIINVAYTHPDPAIASEVANLFAETFIAYNYDLNIDGSLEAVDDLKVRANQQRAVVEAWDALGMSWVWAGRLIG